MITEEELGFYLENETPDGYIDLYEESVGLFHLRFHDYYDRFVLGQPDHASRWQRYKRTPDEWLKIYDYVPHIIAKTDDDEFDLMDEDVMCNMLSRYQLVHRDYLIMMMEQMDKDKSIIEQWQNELIVRQIGSFYYDW